MGHHLLPHLRHTLQEISSPDISSDAVFPLSARTDVCLTLLAASELSGKWKDEALRNVRNISTSTDNVFIELSAAYRESTRMRVKGDTPGSITLLQTTKERFADIPQDSHLVQAVCGLLNVSEALNFVQNEDLDDAVTQLRSWSPLNPNNPSTIELVVLVNAQTQLAKVLGYQGHFEEALKHLEKLHKETIQQSRFENILTDIANELGNVLTEVNRPIEAREILRSEMDALIRKGRSDTAASKLLCLSIAETFMQQGEIEAANIYYLDLSNLGPFAELCHNVGLARVAHSRLEWSLAIERWTGALTILATHFPRGDSHSGYTSLGILKSMHVALSESGHKKLIHQTLEQIQSIEATCALHGCKHWIPGLNSYWMDSVRGSFVR